MKELSQAKARLAPILDDAGRRELALALFRDVLAAAHACPALDAVAVVSEDPDVLSLAADAGAEALAEPGSLNEALASASRRLVRPRQGGDRLVVLAADLPLADAASIEAVVQADANVVIVPSKDGGTNALALQIGAIAFRFGPESARRHVGEAQGAGLRSLSLDLPPLALDIDTPEDLDELRRAVQSGGKVGASTRTALVQLGLVAESNQER